MQDLRYAFRGLRTNPGFTIAAMATLALGLGANTAIFSVINTVLLRPLPYPEPDGLVRLWATNAEQGQIQANVNPLDFRDWKSTAKSFEHLAAYRHRRMALTGDGEPEKVRVLAVSADFFPMLGVMPTPGRGFLPEENEPGGPTLVILSHRLWQQRFGADPGVLDQELILEGSSYTIIGVMPPNFQSPGLSEADQPLLWLPLRIEDRMGRGGHWLNAMGRLDPSKSLEQAQEEMNQLTRGLEERHPDTNTGWRVRLQPLKESMVGTSRGPLVLLLSSVGLVLLIACGNVANLLLARSAARQQEIAMRAVLGASNGRLARQFLTESLVISLLGGGLGLLLAFWLNRAMARFKPGDLPRLEEIDLDARVLLFALTVAVLTGLVVGLVPALRNTRLNLSEKIQGERGPQRSSGRLLRILVTVEMALALVLLIGAGLLLKSFFQLTRVDIGFDPENLSILEIDLPGSRYDSPQAGNLFQEALDRINSLPGVESASAVDFLPFSNSYSCNGFQAEATSVPLSDEACAEYRITDPSYFRTLGVRILQGRPLEPGDRAETAPVAVINESLARQLWPDGNPLGRRLTLYFEQVQSHEVVGVVADVRHFGFDKPAAAEIYVSHLQHPTTWLTLTVRTNVSDNGVVLARAREQLRELDPQLPLPPFSPFVSLISESLAAPRLRMRLLTAFAALALILAAVGLYGVMSFSVNRRVREIGIRMALGAAPVTVLKLIVRQSMRPAVIGITIGLVAALMVTRLLASFLFNVSTTDLLIFTTSILLLSGVALVASLVPAKKASRLDPSEALRTS